VINDEDVKAPCAPATFWRSAQGFLLGFAFGGVAVAVWCNGHNVMRLNPRIYTPIFLVSL
jgi:hypothetical protein